MGLRWFTREGTVSVGFASISTSGILVAFALLLGATNFHIGVLAAIPFLTQLFQIPSIWLVDKFRRRKAIAILSWLPAQLLWFPIALIPFMVKIPGVQATTLLLGLMTVRGLLSAITSCSWNSWIRDLVPQSVLGRVFSRRMTFATIVGVVFGLAAAYVVDHWNGIFPGTNAVFGYSSVLIFGALFLGLSSPIFMSFIPETLMQPAGPDQLPFFRRLTLPFRDNNFRRLLLFLFYWGFASNLAIPFFAIHMLQRLGISITWVILLSIVSQTFNIMFLRIWGNLADRFSNKSVLSLGVSLYLMVILGWIFTTMPEKYVLTFPLLIFLHIFAGIASAAVTFTVGTIGLKLSPEGDATTYLAGASLASNIGAGLGPLAGGILADFFSSRQLDLVFTWIDPVRHIQLPAVSLIGRDFLFAIAFLVGLMTLGVLSGIKEQGEASRDALLDSLMSSANQFARPMSSVPGFNFLSNFPLGLLKKVPVPGLDVAFGITVFQLAEMARAATSATIMGRRATETLTRQLERRLGALSRSRRKVSLHGIEIARSMARGAVHVVDEKDVETERLVKSVMESVITSSIQAGVKPDDAILGASEGIIQGANEAKIDIGATISQILALTGSLASKMGLSEEMAAVRAGQGAIIASEAEGPQIAAEVEAAIPDDLFARIIEEIRRKEALSQIANSYLDAETID